MQLTEKFFQKFSKKLKIFFPKEWFSVEQNGFTVHFLKEFGLQKAFCEINGFPFWFFDIMRLFPDEKFRKTLSKFGFFDFPVGEKAVFQSNVYPPSTSTIESSSIAITLYSV